MGRRPPTSLSLDAEASSFVVEGYNWARPFSNFLPGIAGEWGVPVWVYWVSRAQAVASVGVRDKDGQILEFQSARSIAGALQAARLVAPTPSAGRRPQG